MVDVTKLIKQLRLHEGVRPLPYKDSVGKWTIGVGRNFEDVKFTMDECEFIFGMAEQPSVEEAVHFFKVHPLDDTQIDLLLENDIRKVTRNLDRYLSWYNNLSEVRQRVLCDMCFNLGINGLLGFKNTINLIKLGKYYDAADAMLESKWAKQVGKRARRLADMMGTGIDYT